MNMANFIKKNFLGQKICLSINNGEAETLTYNQSWLLNREYFEGLVEDVDEGIIVLNIKDKGVLYLNASEISYFWQKPFDPHKHMKLCYSKKAYKIGK